MSATWRQVRERQLRSAWQECRPRLSHPRSLWLVPKMRSIIVRMQFRFVCNLEASLQSGVCQSSQGVDHVELRPSEARKMQSEAASHALGSAFRIDILVEDVMEAFAV